MQALPVRCRSIQQADLDGVAALLCEGFPERGRAYWNHALQVLRDRHVPEGYPRYGMMLEVGGACVGLVLQIFFERRDDDGARVWCNLSSWYVQPAFRSYGTMMVAPARRHREVTYLNVSPAEHTWPILQAQGYHRYSEGQFACLPSVSLRGLGVRVRPYGRQTAPFLPEMAAFLEAQARLGLIVLVAEGRCERAPFAFIPREVKGVGRRVAQLAWCPDTESFVRFAGPLGRHLMTRGLPIVILDGHGPLPGLVGRFFKDRAPKYFRGEGRPRLNDLADTEAVLFGV